MGTDDNENGHLYVILFPNGKRYFGVSSSIRARVKKHKTQANTGNEKPLYRALRKYGWENIQFKVLQSGLMSSMKKLEILRIKRYKTCILDHGSIYGYNITRGGEGTNGYQHTSEWKAEQSKRSKGDRNPMFGVKLRGESNPNWGRKASQETREKQRMAKLGKPGNRKGKRGAYGERVGTSKLKTQQVLDILRDTRYPRIIALEYGVSKTLIKKIKARQSWKHL